MTPRYFDGYAVVYAVNNAGRLTSYNANTSSGIAVRPVIALNANTSVTGAGTVNDPYMVQ